jgi:hypothetical protein
MTNNICPDCSRHIEFYEPDTSFIVTNKQPSTPNTNYHAPTYTGSSVGGHNKISTAGIIFNVIAAVVIISICLFVAYQVMISG